MAPAKKAAAKPPGRPDKPAEVPGEVVESDLAGTGKAVNADTGEVTPAGEPLPPVPDDGDGHGEPPQATPIGVEPVIRVGGHTLTEDGWVPDKEK